MVSGLTIDWKVEMFFAAILAVSLVLVTFLFHYLVLRLLSGSKARIAMTAGIRICIGASMAMAALRLTACPSRPVGSLGRRTDNFNAPSQLGGLVICKPKTS